MRWPELAKLVANCAASVVFPSRLTALVIMRTRVEASLSLQASMVRMLSIDSIKMRTEAWSCDADELCARSAGPVGKVR